MVTIRYHDFIVNYKISLHFRWQGAQAVGMGVEAQKVPVAAEMYKKANEILGWVQITILTFS